MPIRAAERRRLARTTVQMHGPFLIDQWRAEPQRDVLLRGSTEVKLVPKSMEVLTFLAQRAGEVVSQKELESAVWRGVIVTPSSVYQAIADLRRALGDSAREPKYIVTVPRKGYRLIAPVSWIDQPQVEPQVRSTPPSPRRPVWIAAAAAAILSLAVVGTWLHGNTRHDGAAATRTRVTVQLIDARTGSPLWSQTYEASAKELLAIQQQITQAMAERPEESAP